MEIDIAGFDQELIKECKTNRDLRNLLEGVFTTPSPPNPEIATFGLPCPFDPTLFLVAGLGSILFYWGWNLIAVDRNKDDSEEVDYRLSQVQNLVDKGMDREKAIKAVNEMYDRLDKREASAGAAKLLEIVGKYVDKTAKNPKAEPKKLERKEPNLLEHKDGPE